jgi:uncharacterized protein (TIGR03032 family)
MIGSTQAPSGVPGPGRFVLQPFNAVASEGFAAWLADRHVALAVTTGDRLMLIGLDRAGSVRIDELAIDGATGLACDDGQTLWVAGRWRLHRFEQALAAGEVDDAGHDKLFVEQATHTTGFVACRDIAVAADGTPRFASALFNCVAMPSRRHHFTAVWRPPFVSCYVGEDRAHVTGVAVERGQLAFVTCAAASDVRDGWRAGAADGGLVVDAASGETIASGLSLPHSPRLHDGRLLVAAAGTGELCAIDPATGAVEPVVRVAGLARGLAPHGRFAVLGCSRVRPDDHYGATLAGMLPEPAQRHAIVVVDLDGGRVVHELELHAASGRVYAIAVLEETACAGAEDAAGGLREQLVIAPLAG